MKKIISLLIILCLLLPVSGCSSGFSERKYIDEVLGYLSDKDAENFKSMFCPIITDLDNLDEQIQEAFDFIDGEIVSHSSPQGGSGKSWERGVVVRYSLSPYLEDTKTDTGKVYDIRFSSWIVNKDYPDRVGISQFIIEDENGERCKVGGYYIVHPEEERWNRGD